jgi:hypothetical protein
LLFLNGSFSYRLIERCFFLNGRQWQLFRLKESPTTRGAGGLDFSAIGGKIQRHGSALIGAGAIVDARAKHPV